MNVEKIMEEIREEIKEKGYTEDMLSFQDVDMPQEEGFQYQEEEYIRIVNEINRDANIAWYRPLTQTGLKGLVKKVVRRLVAFLIAPMSDEQNLFNSQVTRGINQISGYIRKQNELMESYRENINQLESRVAQLEQQISSFHNGREMDK